MGVYKVPQHAQLSTREVCLVGLAYVQ